MAAPDTAAERQALLTSIGVTFAFGALGVVWGVVGGSQMILFDGVFAFVGIVLGWLMLRASALTEAGPTRRYPYGREGATPLAIGVQGFVLLGTILYASVEAAFTIAGGGSDITATSALAYAVISTVASVATWLWLHRRAAGSDLVAAEVTAWRGNAMASMGMVAGFSVMAVLVHADRSGAAAYVDPVMVLVTCGLFVPLPTRMVRDTIVELLEGAPRAGVQRPVLEAITEVQQAFGLRAPDVRMTKVGPKLYVEVDVRVAPDVTVAHEDTVRAALRERLEGLPYDVWLNMEFTAQPLEGVAPADG